jgi:hypothetical protein
MSYGLARAAVAATVLVIWMQIYMKKLIEARENSRVKAANARRAA